MDPRKHQNHKNAIYSVTFYCLGTFLGPKFILFIKQVGEKGGGGKGEGRGRGGKEEEGNEEDKDGDKDGAGSVKMCRISQFLFALYIF